IVGEPVGRADVPNDFIWMFGVVGPRRIALRSDYRSLLKLGALRSSRLTPSRGHLGDCTTMNPLKPMFRNLVCVITVKQNSACSQRKQDRCSRHRTERPFTSPTEPT